MTEISDLITALQKLELIGQCPECRQSSNLQEFQLFDGTIDFPDLAKEICMSCVYTVKSLATLVCITHRRVMLPRKHYSISLYFATVLYFAI